MSRFTNTVTGVTVSVDDSKDERFGSPLWEPADKKTPKKASSSKSDKK